LQQQHQQQQQQQQQMLSQGAPQRMLLLPQALLMPMCLAGRHTTVLWRQLHMLFGCGCNPGHAGVTGSIPTTVENCGLYILGRLSVTSAQVASRQGGGGLGGLPLFMCPHVIIIQACVSRPQTAPPSQGAGPMGGILWRYGAKGGPYGLLLLLCSGVHTFCCMAGCTGLGC
jgi:hypothetical protein